MVHSEDGRPPTSIEPEKASDAFIRTLGRSLAKIYCSTPRVFQPSVWMLFLLAQIVLTAIITVTLTNLLVEQEYVVDTELLLWLSFCSISATLGFGIAREHLPLPVRIRPWALSFIASLCFWLALDVLAYLKHGKTGFYTLEGVLVRAGAVIAITLLLRFVVNEKQFNVD